MCKQGEADGRAPPFTPGPKRFAFHRIRQLILPPATTDNSSSSATAKAMATFLTAVIYEICKQANQQFQLQSHVRIYFAHI